MKMAGQIQNDPSDQIWTVEIRKAKGYLGSNLVRGLRIGRLGLDGEGKAPAVSKSRRRRRGARRKIAGAEENGRSGARMTTRLGQGASGGDGEPYGVDLVDAEAAETAGDARRRTVDFGVRRRARCGASRRL
jgi:hypothetical protein